MVQQHKEANLKRFRDVLTKDQIQNNIMPDLQRHSEKKNHWMWWGFPQHIIDIQDKSQNTKLYSIREEEVIPFVINFNMYYKKALKTLKKRIENDNLDLQTFFSPIDYKKFVDHIRLFEFVCASKRNDVVFDEIYKLLRFFKYHLKLHQQQAWGTDDEKNIEMMKNFLLENVSKRLPHIPADYIIKRIQFANGEKTEEYMLKLWHEFRKDPSSFLSSIEKNDKKVAYRRLIKLFLRYAANYSNINSLGSFFRKLVAKLSFVPYKYIGQYFTDQTEGLQKGEIQQIQSKIKSFENSKRRYIIWLAIQTMFKTDELKDIVLQSKNISGCKMNINGQLFGDDINMINKVNRLSYKCLQSIYNELADLLARKHHTFPKFD